MMDAYVRSASLCAGDMDLDPDTGQYRFSAEVPLVEANALRATLGVRPLPQPLAGALRGSLHITGPLEEPLFSGACLLLPTDAGRGSH
jgi:hypothetical protein